MTRQAAAASADPAQPDPPAAILDAVCCVQFCAAGKWGLLLAILVKMSWEIWVPAEVDKEVRDKDKKYPGTRDNWKRFTANDRVRVQTKLVAGPDPSSLHERVAAEVIRLRSAAHGLSLGPDKDLGETAVVAYGVVLTKDGRDVLVLLDDGPGVGLAVDNDLQVVEMADLLILGHRQGVKGLEKAEDVRKVYDQLRPYGSSLVPWESSGVKQRLRGAGTP